MGIRDLNYVLLLICTCVILSVITFPDQRLYVIACDVGQGDGILIIQGSNQIVIDGGPNDKILECLGRHIPFWDRRIEMIVVTHPQSDHYMGFLSMKEKYSIESVVKSKASSSSESYQVLEKWMGSGVTHVIEVVSGQQLRLGLMQMDIFNPVVGEVFDDKTDPNDYSVSFELNYGEFSGFFTGDISPQATKEMLATRSVRDVDYLKVPHHGSKNGLTKELLDMLNPEIVVISAGKKNRYGHPSPEILEMLKGREIRRTDLEGDVEIIVP
jgi:competence protein ComEC